MTCPRAPGAGASLRVGGLAPMSASDWPGQLAAVIFCQGCPWRCGYCHNPHLQPARVSEQIAWCDVQAFLERRSGLLDAVVFSGGEPTLQAGIAAAVKTCRALGFKVGLHTAGMYPRRLAELLPLLDWVALDIKAPFADYAALTGVAHSGDPVRESVRLVLASAVAHELRTTIHPQLLSPQALARLATELTALGARHIVLQEFRRTGCADTHLNATAPGAGFIDAEWRRPLAGLFDTLAIRHT